MIGSQDTLDAKLELYLSDQADSRFAMHRAIQSSPGMTYINRSHARSFSLNIFQMTPQELIEITQQVKDPEEGLRLWHEKNQKQVRLAR
jgi:hypothetical protein